MQFIIQNIIFLFIIILFSCTKGKVESVDKNKLATININTATKIENSLDIFESVEVVHLSMTGNSKAIGEIRKVIFDNQTIYLHDIDNQSIIAYDLKGDFIFEIDNQGRGPGEYRAITDFRVNHELNELVIFDSFKRSLFTYDLAGNFKREIPFWLHADGFTQTSPDEYMLYVNYHPNVEARYSHHNLIKIDTTGQPDEAYFKFDPSINKSNVFRLHQYIDHFNNLLQPFNDTIYHLTTSGPSPEYFIDFGNQTKRQQCYEDFQDNRHWMEMMNDYALVREFHETKAVITFYYGTQDKNTKIIFYSKDTGNVQYALVNENNFLENAHIDIPFSPSFFSYDEGLINVNYDVNLAKEEPGNLVLLLCKFKTF